MSSSETGRLKVLLVDDDPLIRRGYGDRLAEAGWEVTVACDGFEAVQAARDETFDVVLLDLRMPYRDGAEVLRTLRADPSFVRTRVFLLAQPGDADLVEQAVREGVEAVFEKARLGPRDIVSELQVRLTEPFVQRGPAPPVDMAATQNVPSEVDEIARRFRRGNRAFSGDGPPPASEEIPADVAKLVASKPRADDAAAAEAPPEPEPITGPTIAMSPMSIRVPPPAAAHARERSQSHPAPALAPRERTITGEVVVPPKAEPNTGSVPPAGADGAFNVVLNRYVGEAVQLAHAMGLPPDLMCPVCQRQLALRLMRDGQHESAVHGFFYCPRCTAG